MLKERRIYGEERNYDNLRCWKRTAMLSCLSVWARVWVRLWRVYCWIKDPFHSYICSPWSDNAIFSCFMYPCQSFHWRFGWRKCQEHCGKCAATLILPLLSHFRRENQYFSFLTKLTQHNSLNSTSHAHFVHLLLRAKVGHSWDFSSSSASDSFNGYQ